MLFCPLQSINPINPCNSSKTPNSLNYKIMHNYFINTNKFVKFMLRTVNLHESGKFV